MQGKTGFGSSDRQLRRSKMVDFALAATTRRYANLLRRAVEVVVVLFLAFITTVLYVTFGWATQLFKPSPRDNRIPANSAAAFPAANTSKEY
jgi:hypothetical protein